jgi:lipopolysaccharide export system permease protein
MAATLFLYNKLTLDSELIAMRAVGHSHLSLARPALLLGTFVTGFMLLLTLWVAPYSAAQMHKMRLQLTSEFSSILFREGVFNTLGRGLTVYIAARGEKGVLEGLMIHDTREEGKPPSTVLAKRGMIVDDEQGPQVVVFDGARHVYDPATGILQRLAFERYTIQLPNNEAIPQRWAQPDERSLSALFNPDMSNPRDVENLRAFEAELHRRITTPLLALVFTALALNALLLGKTDRRGQTPKIILAIIGVVLIQGLFITAGNIAKNTSTGVVMMYGLTLLPLGFSLFIMTERGMALMGRLRPPKPGQRQAA